MNSRPCVIAINAHRSRELQNSFSHPADAHARTFRLKFRQSFRRHAPPLVANLKN
jgi:hypothetical protein